MVENEKCWPAKKFIISYPKLLKKSNQNFADPEKNKLKLLPSLSAFKSNQNLRMFSALLFTLKTFCRTTFRNKLVKIESYLLRMNTDR